MTASSTQALRIALIHAGRIIEDRTLEAGKKATVSVGADPRSTFCVPMGELPGAVTVFKVRKDGAVLLKQHVDEGQLSLGGPQTPVSSLAGDEVALPRGAKGRVKVGDVTVLFQMVTPAVAAPAPELPRGARGVVAQLDRAFVVTMALSLLAHLIGAGYVMAQPTPVEPELSLAELQQDRFAAVLMPAPKLPQPVAPEKPKDALAAAPKKTVATKEPSAQAAPQKARPASQDELASKLSRMGMLKVIGAAGGAGGIVGDLLKDSSGVGSVADALKNAGDVRVASAGDALRAERKGAEAGSTVTVAAMGTDGVKAVELRDTAAAAVVGRVREEPVTVETPDISPEALGSWMKGRRGAIQSCYERELKRDRSLSGRLVLKFTISQRGRVTGLDLSEGSLRSAAVADCISTLARNWVLPFTPEDEVPVAFPFVFSPVN
ncbi:MAG: AgmX/PglI C-terminal domain-containing protein [Myxococcus sp.]|nr:AgmX/PglI C-terminal domain-containing protein [Myxococcus sp.]